jgi:hypothetical protein
MKKINEWVYSFWFFIAEKRQTYVDNKLREKILRKYEKNYLRHRALEIEAKVMRGRTTWGSR